jgi:4-amino-4-deoxy-L-arabinose transferase-like glycosyltransferase
MTTAAERGSAPARERIALGILLLAAAGIRLIGLRSQGVWVDEAYTAELIRAPFGGILHALGQDDAPPLFYLLEKLFVSVLGSSEGALRALPALAGWAAIPAAYALARRWKPEAALSVAAAVAFSGLLVFYSQQARGYSLLHLLGILVLSATLALRARPSAKNAIAFGLAALATLYTHNLGVWILASAAVFLLPTLARGARERKILLGLAAAVAIGALPWLSSIFGQIAKHGEYNTWMGVWWKERSLALAPLFSLGVFSNGAAPWVHPPVPLPGLGPGWAGARWLVWASVAAGLGLAAGLARGRSGGATLARGCLVFAAVPLAGLILTSLTAGPAYVVGRTDTFALPPLLIALGLGWNALRPKWLRRAPQVLWIVSGALPFVLPAAGSGAPAKGDDRELASRFAGEIQSADALVAPPLGRPTLQYYARRQGWLDRLGAIEDFPIFREANFATGYSTPIDSAGVYQQQALSLRAAWEARGVDRVWILAWSGSSEAKPGVSPDIHGEEMGEPWPASPRAPPPGRRKIDANAVAFPMNLLVYSLVGLEPVDVVWEYRQDWVGGDRLVLRVDRDRWVDPRSLPPVEVRR